MHVRVNSVQYLMLIDIISQKSPQHRQSLENILMQLYNALNVLKSSGRFH